MNSYRGTVMPIFRTNLENICENTSHLGLTQSRFNNCSLFFMSLWEYKFIDPEKRITQFHFRQETDLFIKCMKLGLVRCFGL